MNNGYGHDILNSGAIANYIYFGVHPTRLSSIQL
jgi:hypothetical protein